MLMRVVEKSVLHLPNEPKCFLIQDFDFDFDFVRQNNQGLFEIDVVSERWDVVGWRRSHKKKVWMGVVGLKIWGHAVQEVIWNDHLSVNDDETDDLFGIVGG
jgi:hypothetical protein